jgi:thiol-disulfide isomerase/thioredoxin
MPKSRSLVAFFALCLFLGPALFAGNLPRPAGKLAVTQPGGKQILLSQYQGKVVAVIFILTYCPHCQKITSFLIQDQNEFGPRGFQVLASAIEDGAAGAVPGFVKKFNPPFPVGVTDRGEVLEFLQHPSAERLIMPRLALVDRKGMIRAQYGGDDSFLDEAHADANLRGKILELLQDGAPKPAGKTASK